MPNQGMEFSSDDIKKMNPPEPLFRELPPSELYPLDALGSLLKAASESLVDVIQAPMALCGQSLLGAAALAVQPHANVYIDGRTYPLSLFMLTVGQSGERKSAVDAEALRPHRKVEKKNIEKYELDFKEYDLDFESWDTARKKLLHSNKSASKDDIRFALHSLGPKPIPPLSEIMLMDEPTLEGLQKALVYGRPSVGIFSDEGGRTVGGHGMNSDNQLKMAAGLCGLWDGSPVTRVRAGDGVSKIYGKRLSVHLMFQPLVAEQFMSNAQLQDQGLFSRCLIARPETTVGTRFYKNTNFNDCFNIQAYRQTFENILTMSLPISDKAKNELAPRNLNLVAKAYETWKLFHNDIERKLKEGEIYFAIRGFGSKSAEHALRISGVLALVENINAGEIKQHHLLAAVVLVEYYLSEALRLRGAAVLDPKLVKAQKLLMWCQGHQLIYAAQVYQFGPNDLRDKKTAIELLTILESHAYLKKIDPMEIDGAKRKDVWAVIK